MGVVASFLCGLERQILSIPSTFWDRTPGAPDALGDDGKAYPRRAPAEMSTTAVLRQHVIDGFVHDVGGRPSELGR